MTARTSRPASIERAALCLWISGVLVILVMTVQLLGWVSLVGSTPGMTAGVGLGTAALLGFVAAKVSARHSWVRWLFAVIYVLGTLGTVALVVITPEVFRALPLVLQANMIAQLILQTIALVLMFTTASRQWLATKHAQTAP
jgi:Na+-translocating ferredoxin:NAD+ oxidoreductase RnfA subunit